jgi:hypothetical protein
LESIEAQIGQAEVKRREAASVVDKWNAWFLSTPDAVRLVNPKKAEERYIAFNEAKRQLTHWDSVLQRLEEQLPKEIVLSRELEQLDTQLSNMCSRFTWVSQYIAANPQPEADKVGTWNGAYRDLYGLKPEIDDGFSHRFDLMRQLYPEGQQPSSARSAEDGAEDAKAWQTFEAEYKEGLPSLVENITVSIHSLEQADMALNDPDAPVSSVSKDHKRQEFIDNSLAALHAHRARLNAILAGQLPLSLGDRSAAIDYLVSISQHQGIFEPTTIERFQRRLEH